ncbi:MAG: hypothetical protein PHU03_05890, partial [Syntrophales bacterium]|nr:hypothetical protein [Syntrophales bacterium]
MTASPTLHELNCKALGRSPAGCPNRRGRPICHKPASERIRDSTELKRCFSNTPIGAPLSGKDIRRDATRRKEGDRIINAKKNPREPSLLGRFGIDPG